MSTLPTNCPKCSFRLAPMVYVPADGNSLNVLNCMNCGWAVEITVEQAAMLEAVKDGVSLSDHQWGLMLHFMKLIYTGVLAPQIWSPKWLHEVGMELARIDASLKASAGQNLETTDGTWNSPQPSVPSMSEGSKPYSYPIERTETP